jgi:hypothetical protein
MSNHFGRALRLLASLVAQQATARRAALNIAANLCDAKWDVKAVVPVDGFQDEVTIQR